MSRKYKFRNPVGLYFTTMTVVDWIDVFSREDYRNVVLGSLGFCRKQKGLNLHAWCLMTNHLHMIVSAKESFQLENVFRDFKKFTAREILKQIEGNAQESRKEWLLYLFREHGRRTPGNEMYGFWQQGNHPKEIITNEMLDQKLEYTHMNPVAARIVEEPHHYLYSSARDYNEMRGLIEIDLL